MPSLYGLRRVATELAICQRWRRNPCRSIGQKSTPAQAFVHFFFNYETKDFASRCQVETEKTRWRHRGGVSYALAASSTTFWRRGEPCRDVKVCGSRPRFLSAFYSHRSCPHRRSGFARNCLVARRRPRHHLQRLFLQPTSGSKSVGASGNQPRTRWVLRDPDQTIAQVSIGTYWRKGRSARSNVQTDAAASAPDQNG